MKVLNVSIKTVILRFYLMIAIVLVGFLTGFWLLSILLAMPVFYSALMGISFKRHHTITKPDISRSLRGMPRHHYPAH